MKKRTTENSEKEISQKLSTMNILVLSNCPTVESQGSGYVIVNTAKSLEDLGHQVDMISPEKLDFLPSFKNRIRNYRMAIGMAKWVYINRKKLAKANYELVIFYGAESAFALFILKKVLKWKVPVVLHSNGLEMHVNYRMKEVIEATNALSWYHFDQSWIFKYCYKNVDAIITVSKYEHDFAVKKLCLPSDKIYFIEPCLPEVFFDNQLLDSQIKKPIIAYCGTWIARKGVNVTKETIPAILRKYPEYSFRIIGTGNDFYPENHFPEDIIDKIEVHPFVETKEQMIKLYSEVSIFLFPSVYESFGLVIAEAMFCGCATVCSSTGFAADIKNDEEALVLKVPDVPHVYKALERLITDTALRKKLAFNGKRRTEQLRWSTYKQHLCAVLDKINE